MVEAFVTRARRIASHSLCQDRVQLEAYANQFKLTVYGDDRLVYHRTLPDEERFESLAGRIRPLLLLNERIYFNSVLEALRDRISHLGLALAEGDVERLDRLAADWAWRLIEDSTGGGMFVEQSPSSTPGLPTTVATMAQLGGGWFYTDLAHNSPTGPRRVALEFPMAERFAAAVHMFAGLAIVVLDLLRMIEELDKRGLLQLDPGVWTSAVTAQTGEVDLELATAQFAPAGTKLPSLGASGGPEWTIATFETLGQLVGKLHNLTARVLGREGELLSSWPAILYHPTGSDNVRRRAMRLGNLVDLPLPQHTDDESIYSARLCFDVAHHTNATLLKQLELQRDLSWSQAIELDSPDGVLLVRLGIAEGLGHTGVHELAAIEACRDLAALEQLAQVSLPVLVELPTPDELVKWRILRLILAGLLTESGPESIDVVSDNGNPPGVVRVEAHEECVNGTTLPVPELLLWHARMTSVATGEAGVFRVSPPPGELFRIWAPALQQENFDPTSASLTAWALPWLAKSGAAGSFKSR